jgi:hypothetical protein
VVSHLMRGLYVLKKEREPKIAQRRNDPSKYLNLSIKYVFIIHLVICIMYVINSAYIHKRKIYNNFIFNYIKIIRRRMKK